MNNLTADRPTFVTLPECSMTKTLDQHQAINNAEMAR